MLHTGALVSADAGGELVRAIPGKAGTAGGPVAGRPAVHLYLYSDRPGQGIRVPPGGFSQILYCASPDAVLLGGDSRGGPAVSYSGGPLKCPRAGAANPQRYVGFLERLGGKLQAGEIPAAAVGGGGGGGAQLPHNRDALVC